MLIHVPTIEKMYHAESLFLKEMKNSVIIMHTCASCSHFPLFAYKLLCSSITCWWSSWIHAYQSGDSSHTFNQIKFFTLTAVSNNSLIAMLHNIFTTVHLNYFTLLQKLPLRETKESPFPYFDMYTIAWIFFFYC